MAFQTGTAASPTELAAIINTFLTANSWTRLEGETDIAPASPKAARYWRIVWLETEDVNTDFRQVDQIELRTVLGGVNVATVNADWLASSSDNNSWDIVSGSGRLRSTDINDNAFWIYYDFGAPTTVREVSLEVGVDNYAPSNIAIQWSNDTKVWTTMYAENGIAWVDGETKVFSFDDAYVDALHVSPTVARRTGRDSDTTQNNRLENDLWVWQGLGYDATRRVYIGCRGGYDLVDAKHYLQLFAVPEWDTEESLDSQENRDTVVNQYLVFGTDPITYWIYANNFRLIVVVKSGTDDYTSAYLGFIGAFALPTQWSLPLYVAGTNTDLQNLSSIDNKNNMAHDPGSGGAARYYRWDNTWVSVQNRQSSTNIGLPVAQPEGFIWPWHTGRAGDGSWPTVAIGDDDSFGSHWLDKLEPTEQNELPILPSMLCDQTFGFLGTLEGIFCIPAGGLATPEQTITVGSDTYRVFPSRTRRNGDNFWCVLEA